MYTFHRTRINPLKIPAAHSKCVCDLSVLFKTCTCTMFWTFVLCYASFWQCWRKVNRKYNDVTLSLCIVAAIDRHEIHTLTSCCTCTDSRLYLLVFVHSGCQVAHAVLYDYCNNFSWKEKCSFFVFMFCKKMITELFFVLI